MKGREEERNGRKQEEKRGEKKTCYRKMHDEMGRVTVR